MERENKKICTVIIIDTNRIYILIYSLGWEKYRNFPIVKKHRIFDLFNLFNQMINKLCYRICTIIERSEYKRDINLTYSSFIGLYDAYDMKTGKMQLIQKINSATDRPHYREKIRKQPIVETCSAESSGIARYLDARNRIRPIRPSKNQVFG